MKKKSISILLFVVILFNVFAIASTNAYAINLQIADVGVTSGTTGNCTWTLNDTILTISGYGEMADYYGNNLPWGTTITELIIEDGVNNIGNGAFCKCKNLKYVHIGNTVINIEHSAFWDCSGLERVIIPESVKSIEYQAFYACLSLNSVIVESKDTSIGRHNFGFSDVGKNNDLVFYCYDNSTTEVYAREEGFTYQSIEDLVMCSHCKTHIFDDNVIIDNGYKASCTEAGLTDGTHCSICGKALIDQEIIPALGHKPVIDSAVKATCQHEGLTVGSHCENCGEVYAAQQIIPKLPHEPVEDEAVKADCTHSGLTEGSHCEICGDIIVPQTVIPALGHNYIAVQGKTATHIHAGITDGLYCDRCGVWFIEQVVIPKLEGDYLLGDADGNGEVDAIDATFIQRTATRIVVPIAEDILMNGDIDEDGELTVLDATLIQRFSTHISVPYPIGE